MYLLDMKTQNRDCFIQFKEETFNCLLFWPFLLPFFTLYTETNFVCRKIPISLRMAGSVGSVLDFHTALVLVHAPISAPLFIHLFQLSPYKGAL